MSRTSSAISSDEVGPDEAPLVALIHGTMDRSTGMLKLSRRLDSRLRVLRYDRRGYGRSTPHVGPFDMVAQVDDLICLLSGRPVVLVGHSYGGNVALAAASRYPELICGVAIYETPLSWQPWWPGTTAGAAARATGADPADAAELFIRRLIGDSAWEALPERTRQIRRGEGTAMVAELRDLQANEPWLAGDISCPVVASYGSLGAKHHRDGMTFVHDHLPNSELIELVGCRHDAPLSHSDVFSSMIVDPLLRRAGGHWARAVSSPFMAP